jgi:heme/copper-type cytochrome/quinol oxidase subunit 1
MNISETQYLFSATNKQISDSIDLFYIGTFIGLAGGLLCACVIVYFKYKKRKMKLESLPVEVVI